MDLAGATAKGEPLDGKSLRPGLGVNPIDPVLWRDYQFSEFFGGSMTWWKIRYPFNQTELHWWCDGKGKTGYTAGASEVFFYNSDSWELTNLAGQNGTAAGNKFFHDTLPLAVGMGSCKGAECSSSPFAARINDPPLQCYQLTALTGAELQEAMFDP